MKKQSNKQLTTSAAALISVDRLHLNMAHKVINVIAKDSAALAAIIEAVGQKNFGPACYWIDDKKARILVPCVEGKAADAVDAKLVGLVATATDAAAGTTAADAVNAIANYCFELKAAAAAKAEKLATRRNKAINDIAQFLESHGMESAAAAAAAPGLKWIKGAKDNEGRYCYKLVDLVSAMYARYSSIIAELDAMPSAPAETTPESNEQPIEEAANI